MLLCDGLALFGGFTVRLHSALFVIALASAPFAAEAQWRTAVLPVVGSAPETGGQFGVALLRTRQPVDTLGTRPSVLMGNAVFTTKQQQRAFLDFDRWTAGNERRLQVAAIASRFPLSFYGFGDNTPDVPFAYEPFTLELNVTRSRKRGDNLWRYVGARVVSTEANSIGFGIDLSCDTDGPCDPPDFICDCGPVGGGGDYRLGLLTGGRLKDTRDNLFAPSAGRVLDVSVSAGYVLTPDAVSNGDALLRLRLDWRGYRALPRGGVLAGQVFAISSQGGFPLDQVALVGNHALNRGYTMGRYRAEDMIASQLEWRSPTRAMNNRLGIAAFSGVAFLFGSHASGRPLPSVGAGLRYRLDPRTRTAIRVDYAVGVSGQSGLYVAFNEAF